MTTPSNTEYRILSYRVKNGKTLFSLYPVKLCLQCASVQNDSNQFYYMYCIYVFEHSWCLFRILCYFVCVYVCCTWISKCVCFFFLFLLPLSVGEFWAIKICYCFAPPPHFLAPTCSSLWCYVLCIRLALQFFV